MAFDIIDMINDIQFIFPEVPETKHVFKDAMPLTENNILNH